MSVLDPQQSSADVRVIDGPAQLWTIAGETFREFIAADTADGYAVLVLLSKELCQRLRQNSDHMLNRAEKLSTHFLDMDY